MKKILKKLKRFLSNPKTTLFLGFLLFLSGFLELSELVFVKMFEKFIGFDVSAHHGVMIFGLSQVFVSVAEIIEGLDNIGVVDEEKNLQEEINKIEEKEKKEHE